MTVAEIWSWCVCLSGWSICGIWLVSIVQLLWVSSQRTLQKQAPRCPVPEEWPRVSVMIPARDEGRSIRAGLESLLASDYPHLELIAINDRSRDETGTIMNEIAQRDPRLKVIHIESLPEGWLGKNHAMHCGQQAATGEWLLFTDGDVIYWPETLALSMRYALHRQLDFLTLFPQMLPGGYWENAVVVFFGMAFLVDTRALNLRQRQNRRAYAGVGAFNLVRRETYQRLGGHIPLRLEILDDVRLGQLFKDAQRPCDLLLGGPPLSVRWQHSFWQTITGIEKNGFAALHYSYWSVARLILTIALGGLCPYVVPFVYPDWRGWGWLATIPILHLGYGYLAWTATRSLTLLPVLPIAIVLTTYAFLRSAWITVRQGGVRWRDTFYSLDELKKHRYRSSLQATKVDP